MPHLADDAILAAVQAQEDAALATVAFVHAHPELAHQEFECSAHLCAVLGATGFEVERGVAGMETAFIATLKGGIEGGKRVGIVCMFDAVATVGEDSSIVTPMHCCGHGPIAGSVIAAGLALASLRSQYAGELVIVGCPADEIHAPLCRERGGGKALTAAAGLWDSIDFALYCHPEYLDAVSSASLWMRRERVVLHGQRSLRAGVQQAPLEAFQKLAHITAQSNPGKVMLERVVFDGDVEEGTGLVLDASFLLFADSEAELDELIAGVRGDFSAGTWTEGPKVAGVQANDKVTAVVAEAFAAAGRGWVADPPGLPFATDFGNISHRVPSALMGVGRPGGWAFHTAEGAEQFTSKEGDRAAMEIAQVLALSASRLFESDIQRE